MTGFPGRLRWLALGAWLVAACSSGGEAAPEIPGAPPADPNRPRLSDDDASLFGPDGELVPSDRDIAGLPLPRGLETVREQGRDHVFAIRAPLAKVQSYFGPRIVTGDVDRIGAGVVYRAGVARGVRGGEVPLDVSILPRADGTVRVEVVELPPPPPEEDEAARRARFERVQREVRVLD